jgi:hypothetical protein
MKTLGTVVMMAMSLLLTAACGTTGEGSGGGGSAAGASSTYGCEGLTGQALQNCQARQRAGSANR